MMPLDRRSDKGLPTNSVRVLPVPLSRKPLWGSCFLFRKGPVTGLAPLQALPWPDYFAGGAKWMTRWNFAITFSGHVNVLIRITRD